LKTKHFINGIKWIGLVALMLIFISWWGNKTISTSAPELSINETDTNGQPLSADSLKGKWVILNVWATWCPPCRLEMPGLERIHNPADVVVIGISTDNPEDLYEFFKTNTVEFPVILPSSGFMAWLNQIHPIEKLPTSFVFNRQGKLVKIQEGFYGDWQIRWDKFWYDD